MTISFVGVASGIEDGSVVTVDIGGVPFERGDLALAMVAYGNPDAAPLAAPDGWARPSGARVEEVVELAGELLSRVLVGGETGFAFRGLAPGPIAAIIAVYRGVSGVSAAQDLREAAQAADVKLHPSPAGFADADGLAVFAYYLWYGVAGIEPDVATTERAEALATGLPSAVSLMLADEQRAAGAVPARTAATLEFGRSNAILLMLLPATGLRTPFAVDHGRGQGRLEAGPLSGVASFEMGHADAGVEADVETNDWNEVFRLIDLTGIGVLRARARLRPGSAPAGTKWRVSLRIDGVERAGRDIFRDETVELAANVSALTGEHETAFRLELVSA